MLILFNESSLIFRIINIDVQDRQDRRIFMNINNGYSVSLHGNSGHTSLPVEDFRL